jgi:enoyl-CoA hydratase
MTAPTTLRTETADGVRSIVFCRAAEYNTITPALPRRAGRGRSTTPTRSRRARHPAPRRRARVLRGYGLDWSTVAQATEESRERQWDSAPTCA